MKIELFIEQGGICCICERPMRLIYGGSQGDEATFEHVKLASEGGKFIKENVPLSCGRCNKYRGTQDFHEFKAKVMEHGLSDNPAGRINKTTKRQDRLNKIRKDGPDFVLETFLAKRLNTALHIFFIESGWREGPQRPEDINRIKNRLESPVDLWKVFEDGEVC